MHVDGGTHCHHAVVGFEELVFPQRPIPSSAYSSSAAVINFSSNSGSRGRPSRVAGCGIGRPDRKPIQLPRRESRQLNFGS